MILISNSRDFDLPTATNSRNSLRLHEPAHRAVGHRDAFALQLLPDLLGAVATVETGLVHAVDLGS